MKIHGNPMKRTTPLRQKTPMKRSGWIKSAPKEKKGPGLAQRIAQYLGVELKHAPKPDGMFRSEAHRRNVASLDCICCGMRRRSQAAHLNLLVAGKGMGLKASDAFVIPLCAPGFLRIGCHSLLDQGGEYDKATSAAYQLLWLQQTRTKLQSLNQWPAQAQADLEKFLGAHFARQVGGGA